MLLSLFTGQGPMHLLNVYSNAQHTAITWLARNIAQLLPVSYMAGDFNSHGAAWDEGVLYQHWDANSLIELAQLMGLEWARLSNHGPTHFPHFLFFFKSKFISRCVIAVQPVYKVIL